MTHTSAYCVDEHGHVECVCGFDRLRAESLVSSLSADSERVTDLLPGRSFTDGGADGESELEVDGLGEFAEDGGCGEVGVVVAESVGDVLGDAVHAAAGVDGDLISHVSTMDDRSRDVN